MTRYFMRDTPLYQMEQMMMTPPHFKPRGHGLRRPTFHYQSEDVDCQYCTNYSKENPCPLCECTCLGERIETGSLSLAKVIEDCLRGKLRMQSDSFRKKRKIFLGDGCDLLKKCPL